MRRRILLVLPAAGALVLLCGPVAQADVWANVGPAPSLAGLATRYPLGNYALDEHFTAVSAGVFSGVDVSGLLPMIAYFFANELWQLTAWLANLLIELFAFAFSLDLVNGSAATNGAGALGPVSRAISSIYADVFGGPWMVLAVSVSGCWAMWKALVQRRYAETAGQLALSLVYVGIAFLFVLQPAQTIGEASHWTNAMSGAFLSIAKDGEPVSQGEAKEAGANQLFGLLVAQPWSVLEFGGLDHCVKAGGGEEPESVAVQPLPEGAARRLESGEQVSAGGKTCIDNLKKYGPHFLRFEPGSDDRDGEFEALSHGDSSKLPDADPGKKDGNYELGPVDTPAAAAMEKGGQYQRLLVAIVVFCAELGAFVLLGALSIGVITAQVLLLLLLAFSPVALVAAAIPGRGHQFFKGWLSKLAGLLLRKAAYSLVLAVLLAVCAAISAATSELGWLLSFGLQCAFFWAVFLQRRSLTDGLIGAVTGPGVPGGGKALEVLALYSGARLGARTVTRPVRAVGSRMRQGRPRDAARGDATSAQPAGGDGSTPDRRPGTGRSGDDPPRPAARSEAAEAAGTSSAQGERRVARTERPVPARRGPERERAADREDRPRRESRADQQRRRAGVDRSTERRQAAEGSEKRKPKGRADSERRAADSSPPRPNRAGKRAQSTPPPAGSPRPREGGLGEELRADAERARAERRKAGSEAAPREESAARAPQAKPAPSHRRPDDSEEGR
ncbi:MAG: hypothetical protein JST53_14760 [Actinobacteria bacterium]|nr:hypothetical protein [Actinomycetota bacterium]